LKRNRKAKRGLALRLPKPPREEIGRKVVELYSLLGFNTKKKPSIIDNLIDEGRLALEFLDPLG
ncbi:hypothetical protein HAX54_014123, partial [Datura stramonium]|nr:hypothetical protein [Datura stramonium]